MAGLLIIETVEELKDVLFRIRSNGKSIGFVPTMGALHDGHLSLIKRAHDETEVVVCSIFVNPTQFNQMSDLESYPKTPEQDIAKIEEYVDIVFMPTQAEIYPEPPSEKFDFGQLEKVMEGTSRPGHFNGVATIVKRLFDWINPDKAYFGEKDFQQLAIIRQLVKDNNLDVQIVACPIVRESNGLAMSSRNRRLTPEQFVLAGNIARILEASTRITPCTVQNVKEFVNNELGKYPDFRLDYFEIADENTLQPVADFNGHDGVMGCVAIYLGDVRLIDNIRYK
ncbi:pantoate--beta-alanine ligase [Bacteroidales bacterium OttesenSCG-928-B11]|nr:pantoate--beta-alanine ligase [Bacteroidales bacterium OttesenSCG-928-E04]MDL2313156.1 pantoate--beta-alanine ligase [Bacteroidales bacterium OttesenSCG-928-B11]MDL2326895.1 pantoate--beta-alanine ligase [Bacteroidales bacterium OttesenSCG-928-A14]